MIRPDKEMSRILTSTSEALVNALIIGKNE